jgi:hypothetical protein
MLGRQVLDEIIVRQHFGDAVGSTTIRKRLAKHAARYNSKWLVVGHSHVNNRVGGLVWMHADQTRGVLHQCCLERVLKECRRVEQREFLQSPKVSALTSRRPLLKVYVTCGTRATSAA